MGTVNQKINKKVIVIGSGFGGLASAINLASAGFDVEIFEKLDKPGGRGYVFDIDGFRFDSGPTVITAPFLLDEIFKKAGRVKEEYFKLVPVQPFYRIFNHEGKYFDYNNDIDFTVNEIKQWNISDVDGYMKLMKNVEPIFQKGFIELADKPFLKISDMIKILPHLIKLKSHKSVYKYISQYISDEFLRKCFSFHSLLVGGNPFHTTSIYTLIYYLEKKWGIHYALGGTGSVINGLVKLFNELGGKINYNSEIREILIENKKVKGIKLSDDRIFNADYVISNADVSWTYKYLIPEKFRKKYTNRKIEKMKYSMSLFVIYFGTKRKYSDSKLVHHNIILSKRYKDLLDDIFIDKKLADDFSLYLHMPTVTDNSIAPADCELFYVLSPVPNLESGTDWEKDTINYRNKIINFLEKNYLPDLQKNIIVEHVISPLYFQNTLNSVKGSAFSVEPLLSQSAWFRPHNLSEEFENLFFAGAGTHPGAGIPGVLSSAKIVYNLICEKEKIKNI